MHHVCLIQSISARKATHIKLGTRSGSSQCQLHFGTKMVSMGWSGCEWLPSECKNAHFQAFPPLAPSDIIHGYSDTGIFYVVPPQTAAAAAAAAARHKQGPTVGFIPYTINVVHHSSFRPCTEAFSNQLTNEVTCSHSLLMPLACL